jgi:PD-(D/E)XK nuclease superfamily
MQGREPETIVSRYAVQRDLYALAAGARGGPVETAYVFLERPGTPVRAVFDEDALEQARARIEELLRRLAAGRFDVTHHPHRSLCLDCPARERLCSHEPTAQLRDGPDPPVEPGGRRDRSSVQGNDGGSEPQLSLLEGA